MAKLRIIYVKQGEEFDLDYDEYVVSSNFSHLSGNAELTIIKRPEAPADGSN